MDPLCNSQTCTLSLFIPICTLGIICNIVVLIGMIGSRLWTRNQYLLIINLCVCDLQCTTWWTIGIIALYNPDSTAFLSRYDCLHSNIYRIYVMFQMSTVLTIIVMAIDHYVAIVLPLRYNVILSRRRMIYCVISTWVIPITIYCILITINLVRFGMGTLYFLCIEGLSRTVPLISLVILVFAAIFIMFYIYIRVLIEIRRSAAFMRNMIGQSQPRDNMNNHRAVVTTLLVLVTFIMGWIPYIISYCMAYSSNILRITPILNTICDPLIYAIRDLIELVPQHIR